MNFVKYVGIFVLFMVVAVIGLIFFSPKENSFMVNIDIQAPMDKTFEIATDYSKIPEWFEGVTKVSGDDKGVGAKYEVQFGNGERTMIQKQKITALENNKRHAYKGVVEDYIEILSDTEFERIDSATTRLKTSINLKATSAKSRLFMNNKKQLKGQYVKNYESLKQLIENN